MKIKIKLINPICKPYIIDKGDWIDLRASKEVEFTAPQVGIAYKNPNIPSISYRDVSYDTKLIPLGIAVQLPKGMEAILNPRSSTDTVSGIDSANSQGVIDGSYNGNDDEWHFKARGLKHTVVKEGDRIAQFKIQLSQKATVWQKIKWLFSNKIEIVYVDNLSKNNRGGFGSTGIS